MAKLPTLYKKQTPSRARLHNEVRTWIAWTAVDRPAYWQIVRDQQEHADGKPVKKAGEGLSFTNIDLRSAQIRRNAVISEGPPR
jgi:hypothetical protein